MNYLESSAINGIGYRVFTELFVVIIYETTNANPRLDVLIRDTCLVPMRIGQDTALKLSEDGGTSLVEKPMWSAKVAAPF